MLFLVLKGYENGVDAADDQFYHPWSQIQKPFVDLKDFDEVVTLSDLFLNADVPSDQH